MRVLILVQWPIPHQGGVSTHVETLISSLENRGHETRLIHGGMITPSWWRRAYRLALCFGNRDRYHVYNKVLVLKMMKNLVQEQLKIFNPEVIHCHDPFSSTVATSLVQGKGKPVIETVHGPTLYEARMGGQGPQMCDFILKCEKTAFSSVSRIISVDNGQFNILSNDYNVPVNKIDVISNAVDSKVVIKQASVSTSLDVPSPFFLVPRRLVEKNGVRYAIEAFARLNCKEVYLVIAGHGKLREELVNLSKEKGVSGRTFFLGGIERAQLIPLYSKAIAVLIPSIPVNGVIEATSLSALEAMVLGTVPIASNIGGLAELIQDRQTGLLVPPADPIALSEAMTQVINDSTLRASISYNAVEMVKNRFSEDKWIENILTIYNESMKKQ